MPGDICRLMGPDNRSHKQLVVKKPKKTQTYIMSKLPRVVKIAEFFIPFFSTFTADFDSSRLQCLIPLSLDELSCVHSSNSAMVMLEKSSCKIYSLKMTLSSTFIFLYIPLFVNIL